MRPDVKDPVQVSADDNRVVCKNCKKPLEPSHDFYGSYCWACENSDEDIL